MARRRNYGFERKQREAARASRMEAKKARKTERDETGQTGPEMGDAQDSAAPSAGQWEWFSPSRGRVVITAEGQRPDEAADDWTLLTEGAEDPGS